MIRTYTNCARVRRRDKVCQKCSRPYYIAGELDVHHIVLIADGGTNDMSNLIGLCSECHRNAPNKPKDFFKWLHRIGCKSVEFMPMILRISFRHFAEGGRCIFMEDNWRKSVDRYIKSNIYEQLISRYEFTWRFRNAKSIWDKDDLNDLFDFKEVTDFVLGKFPEIISDEEIRIIKRKEFLSKTPSQRRQIVRDFCKENPDISYRKVSKELKISRITINKYLNK